MVESQKKTSADFASLREAFVAVSRLYDLNARIAVEANGIRLSRVPKTSWNDLSKQVKANEKMVRYLLKGDGQRASVQGRREVVMAVIAATRSGRRCFDIAVLEIVGRGGIKAALSLNSTQEDWQEQLRRFTDWDNIDSVVAAAEGNNQRAMVGLVVQLAGIGRGNLEFVEADLPQEVEEAVQFIKGSEWLKAGLPRFETASGEALWYLLRIRSVHARMIKVRKQGYYTSMAIAVLHAVGYDLDATATALGLPLRVVEKLLPQPRAQPKPARLTDLGDAFQELDRLASPGRLYCAVRVWRGAAMFAHMLDKRVRISTQARKRLGDGSGLVRMAAETGFPRRDIIRVLSVDHDETLTEAARFKSAVIDPGIVRDAVMSGDGQ